ncbi:DUF3179 domain-containing protein [Motiliproteus coralliicola]|uniref:DUF3179 domain-containing protein n=2 Tax=Motiliproteus coralliicola TaxID=2283196 RepID=A0A369WPB8_9GAMM|nr:DUF3179 domain-containing protein [Motiliproteus coralliicola]
MLGWLFCLASTVTTAASLNGFELEGSLIPEEQILSGGPPRDGIPSIDRPRFVDADQDDFLQPESPVIGLSLAGESRAYPISILNWHELVNDRFGDQPVLISYCPLCGTAIVFDARLDGAPVEFGVSGLLYNSDLLLYDRQSESLWSQITGEAVTGARKGQRLTLLPSTLTSWQRWRQQHPETRLLSTDTGFRRDYQRSPYGDYERNGRLYFPVEFLSQRYHPKERVLGVQVGNAYKAYPFVELAKRDDESPLIDELGGQKLRIEYDIQSRSGQVFDQQQRELPVINSFWFAWYGFHPDTDIWRADSTN